LKNFFLVTFTSFTFSTVLWVIWHFLDTHVLIFSGNGVFFYLPHAARVLCIVYFGYKAIPGLYCAELIGPYIIEPGIYSFSLFIPSLISVLAVPLSLALLTLLGLTLGRTISSPLNSRNYKHIFLITFISAGFNALSVNLYLSRNNLSFPNSITDIEQVYRFFLGDIIGTILVFTFLALLLKPILRQAKNSNNSKSTRQ
tara:strand:- start:140 stop:736 length:597 start_codon:yes stop_codon:yes gene_type:complete